MIYIQCITLLMLCNFLCMLSLSEDHKFEINNTDDTLNIWGGVLLFIPILLAIGIGNILITLVNKNSTIKRTKREKLQKIDNLINGN